VWGLLVSNAITYSDPNHTYNDHYIVYSGTGRPKLKDTNVLHEGRVVSVSPIRRSRAIRTGLVPR